MNFWKLTETFKHDYFPWKPQHKSCLHSSPTIIYYSQITSRSFFNFECKIFARSLFNEAPYSIPNNVCITIQCCLLSSYIFRIIKRYYCEYYQAEETQERAKSNINFLHKAFRNCSLWKWKLCNFFCALHTLE